MKRKLNSKLRLISGLVTILIGIMLAISQGTGAYILIGVGFGYILSSFLSDEKMSQVVDNIVSNPDIIFFRIFELLSIGLIFMEGYTTIGIFAFLSLISVEMIFRKKKGK